MRVKHNQKFVGILIFFFLCSGVDLSVAGNEADVVYAIRKAFWDSTGKEWDGATVEEKEEFLIEYEKEQQELAKEERLRQEERERHEQELIKKREKELKTLQRLEKDRQRKKRNEQKQLERERKERTRQMLDLKRKIQEQRKRNR